MEQSYNESNIPLQKDMEAFIDPISKNSENAPTTNTTIQQKENPEPTSITIPKKEEVINPTGKRKLSILEKSAIKTLFYDHFSKHPYGDEGSKKTIFSAILKEEPELTEKQLDVMFRKAKNDFFMSLPQLQPEALIAKLNEENDYLKTKILTTSNLDIVKQAEVINKLNATAADINKLKDVAPNIQITFTTNLNENDLIKSANKIIDTQGEEE